MQIFFILFIFNLLVSFGLWVLSLVEKQNIKVIYQIERTLKYSLYPLPILLYLSTYMVATNLFDGLLITFIDFLLCYVGLLFYLLFLRFKKFEARFYRRLTMGCFIVLVLLGSCGVLLFATSFSQLLLTLLAYLFFLYPILILYAFYQFLFKDSTFLTRKLILYLTFLIILLSITVILT